jgi:SAM-dependent methyltransferase
VTIEATMSPACWYCGGAASVRSLLVEEMYFGSREKFEYHECGTCRSLFIRDVPADLSRHYPVAYGAHHKRTADTARASGPRRWARILRTQARLGRWGESVAGWVDQRYKHLEPYPWRWLRTAGVHRHSRILDVGCGNGTLMRALHAEGFTHLVGIDKFFPDEAQLPGLELLRGEISRVKGSFDLVMLHHSLEHMPNPAAVVAAACRLLSASGTLLLRVPIADCVAHREFGTHWFQLDAPRHLSVPSLHGLHALGERLSLAPFAVEFDSTATQFEISAGYREGISLDRQRRMPVDGSAQTVVARRTLEERSRVLNMLHLGDMAAVYFRPRDASGPPEY